MNIIIEYIWHREFYDRDAVLGETRLVSLVRSRIGVKSAIEKWANEWLNVGYIEIITINTHYADDEIYCEIDSKRFDAKMV